MIFLKDKKEKLYDKKGAISRLPIDFACSKDLTLCAVDLSNRL